MRRKRISIDTIAKLSGYSRATVSRVIGNYGYVSKKARQLIEEIIEKHNYRPSSLARSMVSGKTQTIGLVISDIRNKFYSVIAKSIEKVIGSKGYTLIICNSDESLDKERKSLDLLLEKQIDGLIIAPTVDMNGSVNDIFSKTKLHDIPTIFIDRKLPIDIGIASVTVDNYSGGYKAAKHLLDLGHERICVVTSKLPLPNVRDRERGFRKALREASIEMKDKGCIEMDSRENEMSPSAQSLFFKEIDTFTAVFCTANVFSIYTLKYLKQRGYRVPEDFSFVGYDDFADAELMDPPPTVIEQPVAEIGLNAARIIMNSITNKTKRVKADVVLPVRMIMRNSTKQS